MTVDQIAGCSSPPVPWILAFFHLWDLRRLTKCTLLLANLGFTGDTSGKESACQCRRHQRLGFYPWVGKISWRTVKLPTPVFLGFPGASDSKGSVCNVGDLSSIPGLGRSPGGGHGNPLWYSCLENPHGQRSLVGYSPQGHKESDMTEGTLHTSTPSIIQL